METTISDQRLSFRPAIPVPYPKEHGAYVVLAAAWLVGALQALPDSWISLILSAIASFFGFIAAEPVRLFLKEKNPLKKRWYLLYSLLELSIAVATLIAIVLTHPAVLLLAIPLLLIAASYFLLRQRRVAMERLALIGFVGISLAAPFAMLSTSTSTSLKQLLPVWLLSSFFFCGTAMNVAIRLKRANAVRDAFTYHLSFLLLTGFAASLSGSWSWTLLPILNLLRFGIIRLDVSGFQRSSLKRIGLEESIATTLYVVMMALILH